MMLKLFAVTCKSKKLKEEFLLWHDECEEEDFVKSFAKIYANMRLDLSGTGAILSHAPFPHEEEVFKYIDMILFLFLFSDAILY
jgi:hypothetical protein